MRRSALALGGLAACALSAAAPLPAQSWTQVVAERERRGERALRVEVEYGAGTFQVRPGTPGVLYRLRMEYDADRFESVREFRVRDGRATLRVGVESRGRVRGLKRGGRLELEVDPDVPLELALAFGAVEAELELGGLRLTELRVETGASDTRIAFREPNRARLESCSFEAGAAAFRVEGLGHAGCRTLRFKGGVGDVTLDFGGRWTADTEAEIEAGVGAFALRVPESVGVRVERETFLSSFDARGLSRTDGAYVSENWDRARHRLTVRVKAVLGAVTIERRPD